MRLEIEIPEHHYNNIMAIDSVSLGRVPYKGIIMYAINAIKRGKALEQDSTTKNNLGVDCISRHLAIERMKKVVKDIEELEGSEYITIDRLKEKLLEDSITILRALPPVTPQEPFKPMVEIDLYSVIKQKYIEREVLDKIRAEVKALSPEPTAYDVIDGNPEKDAVWATLIEVDKIIDKYKAESEQTKGK